ncbi:hypothetical protein KZZ52_40230 [Dactylosporangium sp. AC04546]|uniref:hypothetical protein n=1 Tax=Dactylosporangium sp. AC04546 TaxID=2862460 RepID=UPI001EDE7823|nr:hypothetical protein [Dactylosporangium sp. AC04546]WVK80176.1 hypothetical protein KZZ52_40230 [Dactylosporangium sp. AC04546]
MVDSVAGRRAAVRVTVARGRFSGFVADRGVITKARQATEATLTEADETVTELSRLATELQREVGRFRV